MGTVRFARHRRRVAAGLALLAGLAATGAAVPGCGPAPGEPEPIVLATTTSTQDSGLLDRLLPAFTARTGIAVRPVAIGSGAAIALCRRGEADVLLAHSPAAEERLVADGIGCDRRPLMFNDFVIVGPPGDPAGIRGERSAAAALAAIVRERDDGEGGAAFVSRGDDSGTHARERSVWDEAVSARALIAEDPSRDGAPANPAYIRAGVGMAKTLLLANERAAYTLTDRGTFLHLRDQLALAVLVEGDPLLRNDYHVTRVNAEVFPHVRLSGAARFVDWVTGAEAREIIADHGLPRFGRPLFTPVTPAAGSTGSGSPRSTGSVEGRPDAPPATGLALVARAFATAATLIATGDADLIEVIGLTLRVSLSAALLAALLGIPAGALLAFGRFPGREALRTLARAGMALPPVVVGLAIGILFWRTGPLGAAGILYTPLAMVLAQVLIALPIVATIADAAASGIDPGLDRQIRALGASDAQRVGLLLRELRGPLIAAVLAGFGRAVSEVGASLMVGGNVLGETRVLTTSIVLEVGRGDFERALALGIVLLSLALVAAGGAALLERGARRRASAPSAGALAPARARP